MLVSEVSYPQVWAHLLTDHSNGPCPSRENLVEALPMVWEVAMRLSQAECDIQGKLQKDQHDLPCREGFAMESALALCPQACVLLA